LKQLCEFSIKGFLVRKNVILIGDPLINPNKLIFADAAFQVANPIK